MQSSKIFFSKLINKFIKKQKHISSILANKNEFIPSSIIANKNEKISPSILANRDEFIYDDHISLYSFNDEIIDNEINNNIIQSYSYNLEHHHHIDYIISCYTN